MRPDYGGVRPSSLTDHLSDMPSILYKHCIIIVVQLRTTTSGVCAFDTMPINNTLNLTIIFNIRFITIITNIDR